jgi:quercetin dioxygenase-like cupin family protein
MKSVHYSQVPQSPVDMPGAVSCKIRCLLGEDDHAPSFTMRQFEVAVGGNTPKHTHPYEHEVFVLGGEGVVLQNDQEHPIGPGHAILVLPNEVHQFRNTGTRPLEFLCLIPHPLRGMDGVCTAACSCGG